MVHRKTMFVIGSFLCLISQGVTRSQDKPIIAFTTAYLPHPIGDAHRISIKGELGGKGKVTLDGNVCTINQFGDTQICTERFFPPIDVDIEQVRLADPSGQGRRLFRISGKLLPKESRYFLVVPKRRSQPHRLVVDIGEDKRRVISLEAQSTPKDSGKPELCKNAKYRAELKDGEVTIHASGTNPTSGWKVRFEQLPIEIFPPQFRFVCVKPTGIVAQVVTPFSTSTSFKTESSVKEVIVHDATGKHKLAVE